MKGLGLTGLIMIIVTALVGLFFILMNTVGITPTYYHTLPEVQYIDLLSSYYHITENAKRAVTLESDKFFNNIGDYPLEWDETWSNSADLEVGIENKFAEKLGNLAEDYLNSITILQENVNTEFKTVDSTLSYDAGTLAWDYTYNLYMYIPFGGRGETLHQINSEEKIEANYNFLDLDNVYNCANSFFNYLKTASYQFNTLNPYKLERGLEQKFINKIEETSECSRARMQVEAKVKVSCPGSECTCKSVEKAEVILIFKNEDAALALLEEFNNFQCGELAGDCEKGEDCGTGDCIDGFCGSCYSGTLKQPCSPSGSSSPLSDYKCYETELGEYKCLRYYPNLGYEFRGKHYLKDSLRAITLNCGKEGSAELELIVTSGDFSFGYNGIKIDTGSKKIDLCDISKIPRVNGNLEIYAISGSDNYKIDEISVSFELSKYISLLNDKMIDAEYNPVDCASLDRELEEYYKEDITNYLEKNSNFEGYSIEISTTERNCDEGYATIKVEFEETSGNIPATLYYIIELKT